MAFLIESDYNPTIRVDLFTLVTGTVGTRDLVERQTEAEIKSYINLRYNTSKLFKPNTVWSVSVVYTFNQLVVIQAVAYDNTLIYAVDDLVAFTDSNVYRALAITVAGEDPIGTPAKWVLVGAVDSFYTALPTDDFVLGTVYTVGQFVVYQDVRYIVTVETTGVELPTDTGFWAVDATVVAAGTLPSVTASWTLGDTRDALIIMHMVNIGTWKLSKQGNPRNIREDYRDTNDDSIKWLKEAKDPRKNMCPDWPENVTEAKQGYDLSWNSENPIDHGQNSY